MTLRNLPAFACQKSIGIAAATLAARMHLLPMLPALPSAGFCCVNSRSASNLSHSDTLRRMDLELIAAGRRTQWLRWARRHGFDDIRIRIFPTLRNAVKELSLELELSVCPKES